MNDSEMRLAQLLATLRKEGRQQSGLDPALVPQDTTAGYRVAALVERELGWKVGGWKIAAYKEEMQRALRTDAPIFGRVFSQFVRPTPVAFEHGKLLRPIAEVEFAARMGADLPARERPYTQEEVAEAVVSMHAGIEVAECRFVHDSVFPALPAILADGSGSGSIIYGPPIEDWRNRDIAGQTVVLRVDGVEKRQGTASEAIDHPLVPLTWLANKLSQLGIGLRANEYVSTGTLTGMIGARVGSTYVADYGPFGSVQASFE